MATTTNPSAPRKKLGTTEDDHVAKQGAVGELRPRPPPTSSPSKFGTTPIASEIKPKSHRPPNSRFLQQELPACKPLMTPVRVIAVFMLIAIIFIPIGIAALIASTGVVEVGYQYETVCVDASANQQNKTLGSREDRASFIQDPSTPKNCTISIPIPKYMKQPIHVYYEVSNFHQNHRKYVKSKSESQLQGNTVTEKQLSTCAPEDIVAGHPVLPCGLVAWSLFNDSYNFSLDNMSIPVKRTGIAWQSDIDKCSGSLVPSNFQNNNASAYVGGGQLPENVSLKENEDLWVWMRLAALPRFRKMWGRIEQDLQAGDLLMVNVRNVYNSFGFNGGKKLVLSTASWVGGKNDFLGAAYLTTGLTALLLAIAFFVMHYGYPRNLGDTTRFTWNLESEHNKESLSRAIRPVQRRQSANRQDRESFEGKTTLPQGTKSPEGKRISMPQGRKS